MKPTSLSNAARIITFVSTLVLCPLTATAQSFSDISGIECTDGLIASVSDTASFSCGGDFSLSGGRITSDSRIVIRSGGSLSLNNLSITAPVIELFADNGSLSLGSDVSINSSVSLVTGAFGNLVANGTEFTLAPSGTLSVGGGDIRVATALPRINPVSSGWMFYDVGGGQISLVSAVPEPSTYILMLLGLLAVFGIAKRNNA